MLLILLSIIEAIYQIYMLNFYKSKTNYADPDVEFSNVFLKHPVLHSDVPISMICPAGNLLSIIFAIYLIGREFLPHNELNILQNINFVVIIMSVLMSLINLNAFLYLIPIFIIEIIRLFLN